MINIQNMCKAFSNISAHFYWIESSFSSDRKTFHRLKCSACSSVQELHTDLPSYAVIKKTKKQQHCFASFSNGINSNMHCQNLDFLSLSFKFHFTVQWEQNFVSSGSKTQQQHVFTQKINNLKKCGHEYYIKIYNILHVYFFYFTAKWAVLSGCK